MVSVKPPVDRLLLSIEEFGDPLAILAAECAQHRAVCAHLTRVADDGCVSRAKAAHLIAFFRQEAPRHHAGMDQDFFPLLYRRILPEDSLAPLLLQLSKDYGRLDKQAQAIASVLTGKLKFDPIDLSPAVCERIGAYRAKTSRTLSIETGIILTIARARLKPKDLKMLGQALKLRHEEKRQ